MSGFLSPIERVSQRRRRLLVAMICALGLLVLTLLDQQIWRALLLDPQKLLEEKDWWQLFRQFGSLLFWLILGACLIAHDRAIAFRFRRGDSVAKSGAWHRGLMVMLAAGLSGGAAEVLKGLSQRARPGTTGEYRFGWIEDGVGGLGLASSHAGTAFGGAIMLGWFFPALRWPLLALAMACSMTRIIVGAHYATDVYVAVLLSYAVCYGLWRFASGFPGGANHPQTTWAK
jgi:membrane-associated phospholipid phosphatase